MIHLLLTIVTLLALSATSASAIDICVGSHRQTCVVDGDTVWIAGEKIRIADIDTPEVEGKCSAERKMALIATRRLAELLDGGEWTIERTGMDRHERTLAIIRVDGASVGERMVQEGHARAWTGRRESWCLSGPQSTFEGSITRP